LELFEKTNPISDKMNISACQKRAYGYLLGLARPKNKANLPAFGRKLEARNPKKHEYGPNDSSQSTIERVRFEKTSLS